MLRVSYLPAIDLIPYANNSRTHSQQQVDQIAASIREWGFTNPILIDEESCIIAGHGRLLAAQKLGLKEVPTILLAGLTAEQKRAYVIADNKLALNAGWDEELLALELKGLEDFDLSLLGFSDGELADLLADRTEGNTDEDDIPDEPADPVTVEGDVWILGNHRIVCGSSTEADTVDKVLAGVKPHLMVTDPPYGVEYDANWRNETLVPNKRKHGLKGGNGRAVGKVENDDVADWSEAWALFPGDVAYVWCAGTKSHVVAQSLENTEFEMRSLIIWAKSNIVIGRSHYHEKKEPCWYAVKKGRSGHWVGDRKQTTVWNIDKPMKSETGHSTQKPVECMRKPIENNSNPGQAVYEPFSGSGTTIIACEQTGRHCYAIELNPAYVDMAIVRWQDFTGQEAIHEASGKTYKQLSDAKVAA